MDQLTRNNFGTLHFDRLALVPSPKPRVFHNLSRLAKPSNVLPRLLQLPPPESSASHSRVQKKHINIFKKLVPKSQPSLPTMTKFDGGHRNEQKDSAWEVGWSATPTSVVPSKAPAFSRAGLNIGALPTPTCERVQSSTSGPYSSLYTPQSALLACDRVVAVKPLSYSQPRIVSQTTERRDKTVKFVSCSNQLPPRKQARVLRRKSHFPQPMVLPQPQQMSQASPVKSIKPPHSSPSYPIRKSSSSARRTSRSLMIGPNPVVLPPFNSTHGKKPVGACRRKSILSSDITYALTHGNTPRLQHALASKRETKITPPAALILPSVEIQPLTFSPFLAEFSDYPGSVASSSARSTPSLNTPPNETATFVPTISQKDQKTLRRYGRCPSTFLNPGPNSLIIPLSPTTAHASGNSRKSEKTTALFNEQARKDVSLATTVSTPPPTPPCPPRFESLRGCSRASLEKLLGKTEKTRVRETKSLPNNVALRPKLTLQIPQASGPSHTTVIHRAVPPARKRSDYIKVDVESSRPLPSIPIARQQSI